MILKPYIEERRWVNAQIPLTESAKLRALRALVPHLPHALRAPVFHVPRALCGVAPCAL